jgi:hypothetical protein
MRRVAGAFSLLATGMLGCGAVLGITELTLDRQSDAGGADAIASPTDGGGGGDGDGGGGPVAYETVVMADSPIAYFRLGEPTSSKTVRSAVAPFYQGTIGGEATLGAGALIANTADTAAHLNPMGSISLDVGSFTGVGSFTMEAWLSVESTDDSFRMILNKEYDTADGQVDLANLYVRNGSVVFERYVAKDPSGVSTSITLNAPHHVVGSFDGQSIALYLDGVRVASGSQPKQPAPIQRPLFVGNPAGGSGGFQGVIDELAIYAVALPEPRVLAHFAAGRR